MTKRLPFLLAALALAGAGFYLDATNAREVHAQTKTLVNQDAAGEDTTTALADLRQFVAGHVGASTSFTLEGAYSRAQTAARAAAAASAANSQIYADAQRACAGKSDSITQARCNQEYLSKHLANLPAPTPVPEPRLADYQYQLVSPLWAPDLAGACFAGAAVAAVLALLGFIRRRR
jgi:hypothetical protein